MSDIPAPDAWKGAVRRRLVELLAERIERGNLDDKIWKGRIADGGSTIWGLLDEVLHQILDENKGLVSAFPPGEAMWNLRKRLDGPGKTFMRKRGYDFFPDRESEPYSRTPQIWHCVRLPAVGDSSDYVLGVAAYYGFRALHNEVEGERRFMGAKRDAAEQARWQSDAELRASREQGGGEGLAGWLRRLM